MLTPHVERYSYLFRVEYRTRSGLKSRNVHIVADGFKAASEAALQKARGWRGVIRVDWAVQLGSAIQVSD